MTEHHYSGDELAGNEEIIKRFQAQGTGTAKPEFPRGKLNSQDEGALAFAIAADAKNHVVRIDFNKQVRWMAMDLESARKLKLLLSEKILELELSEVGSG